MRVSRRDVLTGFLLGAAALAVPVSLRPSGPPPLVGDGIADDTAALQWRLDHGVPIVGGTYCLTGPLYLRGRRWVWVTDNYFRAEFAGPWAIW